jgi:hypothetical protein
MAALLIALVMVPSLSTKGAFRWKILVPWGILILVKGLSRFALRVSGSLLSSEQLFELFTGGILHTDSLDQQSWTCLHDDWELLKRLLIKDFGIQAIVLGAWLVEFCGLLASPASDAIMARLFKPFRVLKTAEDSDCYDTKPPAYSIPWDQPREFGAFGSAKN